MDELSLATPSILFSAISLIMLAYTNRFLSYATLIRSISAEYAVKPSEKIRAQISNLRRRLYMTRAMQILGILSLLLCVVCTFLIYVGLQTAAVWMFGIALISLAVSLAVSIAEIQISVRALDIHLDSVNHN
ncbi:MAG: DUF2721 domain-containing protein [Alistipes sp.]|nr:DUF2721 domain-containing protein [Alistipes sp.]MCD8173993.1 DUF2721 domain-containing protein [Alistipes sp.]